MKIENLQESFTLEDVLDNDDVITECKYQNSTLVEYLSRCEVVEQLIDYVITPPPTSTEADSNTEELASKNPYIASELFACEVAGVMDVVVNDADLLNKLLSFLDAPSPLDPACCAYFCKVKLFRQIGSLI